MSDFNTRFTEVVAPVIGYDSDIQVVASDGSWVTAADGKRYLDFTCGIAVSNLGHRHPHVKAAIVAQIDELWRSHEAAVQAERYWAGQIQGAPSMLAVAMGLAQPPH